MATRYYRCRNCFFILDVQGGVSEDQAMGQEDSLLPPDPTRESIDDVLLLWRCPMCQADRDSFDEYGEAAVETEGS